MIIESSWIKVERRIYSWTIWLDSSLFSVRCVSVSPVPDVKCVSRFIFSVRSQWAVGRLDTFLHEDLKIVGCKIKRYFKMCLPVFIASIKASFGSAFWPPWSGGHFYKSFQSMTSSQSWRQILYLLGVLLYCWAPELLTSLIKSHIKF